MFQNTVSAKPCDVFGVAFPVAPSEKSNYLYTQDKKSPI
jgi:hypothetical protein